MGERPAAMYQNGREPVPYFAPDELLYMRVEPDHVNSEGMLIPFAFRLPSQSVNRSKYSEPEWVLIPNYQEWGILSFERQDVPEELRSNQPPPDQSVEYRFEVEHHPCDDNYSHSEIRAYRKGQKEFNKGLGVVRTVKQKFRMRLSECATILKFPAGANESAELDAG